MCEGCCNNLTKESVGRLLVYNICQVFAVISHLANHIICYFIMSTYLDIKNELSGLHWQHHHLRSGPEVLRGEQGFGY